MDMQSMVEANQKSHGEILVELTINSDQLAQVQSNIDSINDSLSKLSTKGGREWTRRPSEGEPIPIING